MSAPSFLSSRSVLSSLSVLALLMATGAQAETLRLAHESSSNSLIQQAVQMFATKLTEKTGGALEVQIFPDAQLGDEAAIADGVGAPVYDEFGQEWGADFVATVRTAAAE